MKILKSLTIKNMRLNKKRTIVTIIGVILSVALICAVAGMITSMQASLIKYAKDCGGNRHLTVLNVNDEDLKYFLNNPHVESIYKTYPLGYAKVDSHNKNKPYAYIIGYDDNAFLNEKIDLLKGRLPKNSSELVISSPYVATSKLDIGDKITLDIGSRVCSDNTKLYQNNPYTILEDGSVECGEDIINTTKHEYEIVGIMARPDYSIEDYSAPGYTMITYNNTTYENVNVSILFLDASYYKEFIDIMENSELSKYSVSYNSELLRWSLASISDNAYGMLTTVAIVVISIIIFTSVYVIKNSFAISSQEKRRMYGMLKSVGATSKQIKKCVLYEGFIIGLIGIPLGIISGLFADYILVKVVNLFGNLLLGKIEFIFYFNYIPVILSIILGFLTIYLSVIISARRSSKISAMEAIRNNNEVKIDKKKIKSKPIIEKIFGIGGVIAYKNLKRTKKRNRTTVISIIVSVAVFISLTTFIDYGFKLSGVYYEDLGYDITVMLDTDNDNTYEDIKSLENVEEYSINKTMYLNLDLSKYLSSDAINYMGQDEEILVKVVSISDEELRRVLEYNNINVENFYKKALLIDSFLLPVSDTSYKEINLFKSANISINEVIDNKLIDFQVVKRIDKYPMGISSTSYSTTPTFIVSDEYFEEIKSDDVSTTLFIKSDNATNLESRINTYILGNSDINSYQVVNISDSIKAEKQLVIIISIFLYGFITVISLIGITNIINTINTNMSLRRRELAMLKSIGMTKNEFNNMIRLESSMYSFKALCIGIPLGLVGSYLVYLAFAKGNDYGFIFPINSIIISIIVVFILVNIIMSLSLKKMKNESIIEVIKDENI